MTASLRCSHMFQWPTDRKDFHPIRKDDLILVCFVNILFNMKKKEEIENGKGLNMHFEMFTRKFPI